MKKIDRKKIKLGWKVVHTYKNSGKMFSAMMHETCAQIQYYFHRWCFPPRGAGNLGVFDTRNHALEFVRRHFRYGYNAKVMRAKYIESDRPSGFHWYNGLLPIWSQVPQGTLYAECVKLIKSPKKKIKPKGI